MLEFEGQRRNWNLKDRTINRRGSGRKCEGCLGRRRLILSISLLLMVVVVVELPQTPEDGHQKR